MAKQVVLFSGGVYNTDTAATPNTIAERDGNGNTSANQYTGNMQALGLLLTAASYTTTATIPGNVSLVQLDATAGAFTATLPPAATVPGQTYLITKIDSSGNLPTVKGNGTELIVSPGVGAGANTYTGLSAQGAMGIFTSNGTLWRAGKLS